MSKPHVLISGASIAGPALAYWLDRYGWLSTVVERSPALRTGGQNIDVRGTGREVVRRMGIEDDIRAATTGERGTRFLALDGSVLAEFPAQTGSGDGPTAELEILRGDLARLLVDRTDVSAGRGGNTEFVWGDRITALREDADQVTVTFEHGAERRFDLVVAADGIGSSTRRLMFGDEAEIRDLGMQTSWFTIARQPSDQDWWRWYGAPGGRTVGLRPDPVGTIRATLSLITPKGRLSPTATTGDDRSTAEHRAELHRRFGDLGWETPRVLRALDEADDLYVSQVAQVRAPRWTTGRLAMIGDAAACPSPVSGMGTGVSLVGAYVLAGELAAHVDHRDGFAGYERIVRPFVERAQQLPPGTPQIANPRSRLGLAAFGLGLRLAAGPVGSAVGALARPAGRSRTREFDLPDYRHLEVARA